MIDTVLPVPEVRSVPAIRTRCFVDRADRNGVERVRHRRYILRRGK